MKGKILGFDAAGGSGAITGEDGQRYSFGAAEWKSGTAPSPGADVDFVTEGSAAKDIYPIAAASRSGTGNARQASAPGPDLSEGLNNLKNALSNAAEGDMAKKSLTVAHQRPQVVLAIIMLFASVFLTWSHVAFDFSPPVVPINASVLTFPSQASIVRRGARVVFDEENRIVKLGGDIRDINPDSGINKARHLLSSVQDVLRFWSVAYLGWLIPAGAAFLLYREFTNTRNRTIELAAGGIALGFACISYMGTSSLVSLVQALSFSGPAEADLLKEQISLGWGCWIVAAAGIGLILTGLGIVRETPGLAKLAAGGNAGAA